MPIFEYICRDCQTRFEAIVSAGRRAVCPACDGRKLDKQHSTFAVSAKSNGSGMAMAPSGGCGTCGDPRGPGSCRVN